MILKAGALQKKLKEAMILEGKTRGKWTEYAVAHRSAFLGDPENAEDDFFEANQAEEERQKKLREK